MVFRCAHPQRLVLVSSVNPFVQAWSMDAILYGHMALRYWRRASSLGGLGSLGAFASLCPRDMRDEAQPRRRSSVDVRPPSPEVLGRLEALGLFGAEEPCHLLVTDASSRRLRGNVVCHAWEGPVPARQLLPLATGGMGLTEVFVSSPELLLVQLAAEGIDGIEWLSLALELCGSYRLVDGELHTKCPQLTSGKRVLALACQLAGRRGVALCKRMARWALDGSGSPAETALAISLGLPHRLGGCNLGPLELNRELELGEEGRAILGRDTITPDILVPFARTRRGVPGHPIEYDSTRWHSTQEQGDYDEMRRNAYASLGMACTILRPRHLRSAWKFDVMAAAIRKNAGRRVRDLPAGFDEAHRLLLEKTLAPWARRRPGRAGDDGFDDENRDFCAIPGSEDACFDPLDWPDAF